MKKHNNAIKMLMKNAIDTQTLYGWYEDDNGARLMTNGHLIIKLSGTTLDYVGGFSKMNDKNNNKRFVDQMNDVVEAAKKGEYKTTVNIQDIKIFDRYNSDKKPFINKYSDNSYIGFNPYYFNKINILTGSDLLTITDSKSPMYIAGDDIECVLLPVMLDKNYNADNYAVFLEELKACYIQDAKTKEENEKQKSLKNTDKIEKEVVYNGFTLYFAGRTLFILSDKKRVTNDITNEFLKIMSDITGIDYMNKITENDYKYYKSGAQAATITKTTSYSYNHEIIRIETKYNSENFYNDEYNKLYIYNANLDKIHLDEFNNIDMSSVKPNTAATIQDNAADNMSATDTDTAADTDTANNDSITTDNNRKKVLHGFYMAFKNRDIFVATNEETKRRYIVQAFITEMINMSNHLQNITEEKRNNILNDEEILKETKKRITPATIEEIWTRQENHIRITSDNNNLIVNHSLNNFKTIVIECFGANEGMTPTQETSFKFFSGISKINNQLTETMQADARQTETTQDKPHKASTPVVSLFVVTDKPQPVKLPGYELPTFKQLDRIPMYVERFKTDFKQRNNARVYKSRVSNIKALKNDYTTFNSPVSCHNGMRAGVGAIGGKVAAGGHVQAVNTS